MTEQWTASEIDRPARIVICGAGIAGLVLAIRLASMGHRPVVFEAREEAAVRAEGVFLTLAPHGANGLRAIGCLDAVKAHGIDTIGIEIYSARGRRLAYVDQSDHERAFGAPSITIQRGRLADILLARARTAGVSVRFGARVTSVAQPPEEVRLRLSDGTEHAADMLVAADGLQSAVRGLIFPEFPQPRFTGLIGTGGITEARIPDTGGVMRMTFGARAFFGYLKAPGQPVYWFNSYAAEAGAGTIADPATYAREILALHAEDPVPNAEILRHVGRLERNYPIHDLPALSLWHKGRAVLIGDAAHAMGPHGGQGASMAIEDALVLAACLEAEAGYDAAFRRYESLRRDRIGRVAKLTARNGSRKQRAGRLSLMIRDLILPFVIPLGVRAGRSLLAFRADMAPLAQP